ncbi:Putative uncharacterized protein FLJ37770, partial [Harpegnathos saltator]
LRTALIFCYHLKKAAVESHRMLVETYGELALSKSQCFEWFKKFKPGGFEVSYQECSGAPQKVEHEKLKELLDEDSAQTQKALAEQVGV